MSFPEFTVNLKLQWPTLMIVFIRWYQAINDHLVPPWDAFKAEYEYEISLPSQHPTFSFAAQFASFCCTNERIISILDAGALPYADPIVDIVSTRGQK